MIHQSVCSSEPANGGTSAIHGWCSLQVAMPHANLLAIAASTMQEVGSFARAHHRLGLHKYQLSDSIDVYLVKQVTVALQLLEDSLQDSIISLSFIWRPDSLNLTSSAALMQLVLPHAES